MTEADQLSRHLINRNAALRMSEDLKMPEILEAYDQHMERQRIGQAQTAFAKDIARQCVEIERRQKAMPKMVVRNGCVMTEAQEKHYDLLIEKATS